MKNSKTMYDELKNKQKKAIMFAEKLLNKYATDNPGGNNPSTTVHLLVEEIKKFI